jgi:eukaryotic-like serine/threonine-protein kinase
MLRGKVAEATASPQAQIDKEAGEQTRGGKPKEGNRKRSRRWLPSSAAIVAVTLGTAIWYLHRPLPQPHITGYAQITRDGREKRLAGTDGSRLYFTAVQPKSIAQIGVAGGEIAQIPVALPGIFFLLDVSPDGSNLLVESVEESGPGNSIFSVRTLGGSLHRMRYAEDAAFSPDGNFVVYMTAEGELWSVQSDGAGPHKLASVGRDSSHPRWSPDGGVIRFDRNRLLWEISANGSNLHQLLPGWHSLGGECCGRWTLDGKFYLFLASASPFQGNQIWALDERRRLFRHPPAEPVQLTPGPISWGEPIPGKNGKEVFSDGSISRGELCRFDSLTKQLQPFLGGISAQDVSFSKDGQSVAYVSFPEGILWKASRDGSNPLQLSTPPLYAQNPRWSPDGTQIVFTGLSSLGYPQIYIVSTEGSSPRQLMAKGTESQGEPNWSSDGRKIVFDASGSGIRDPTKENLRVLDLASHQVTVLPGSTSVFSPRWSPDGKYIAALSLDVPGLKVFDIATQRWSAFPENGRADYPAWSRDSRFIYFLRLINGDRGVYRIRVGGGKTERVADLKDWHITGYYSFWMALDPTDSPLLLRDNGSDDIYALKMEEK